MDDGIENGIDILREVFQEQWQSILDGMDDLVEVSDEREADDEEGMHMYGGALPWLRLLDDDEAVWFLAILDPFDPLKLRVNDQRPS